MANFRQRKRDASRSSVEEQLEEAVFGKDILSVRTEALDENLDLEVRIDRKPALRPAWEDEDDKRVKIHLDNTSRLKKLKLDKDKSVITGDEMQKLLKQRYKQQALEWAELDKDEPENTDGDLLNQTERLVEGSGNRDRRHRALPPERIHVTRLVDANADSPAAGTVSAVRFHKTKHDLLFTASMDRTLRFFRIDKEKNPQVLSVKFENYNIFDAQYLGKGSSEVVVTSRSAFYYIYDIESGRATKIPGIPGKDMRTHEHMAVSPEGTKLAFGAASGYIHVCDGRHRSWLTDVKMNRNVSALRFLTETVLVTGGQDSDLYVWDLRFNGRCLHRYHSEDGSGIRSIDVSEPLESTDIESRYVALGQESGVVSVLEYSALRPEGLVSVPNAGATSRGSSIRVAALKNLMNLTLRVNKVLFHPSAQILAMSSNRGTGSFKLAHMPSCSVYSNWPTEKTPLKTVHSMDFNQTGNLLAVGNSKGRVLLYQINHFHVEEEGRGVR